MTGFLASVRSLAEAEIAAAAGADIIDLKDPASGALGALPAATIGAVVAAFAGRATLSATAGDLAMDPAAVARRVGGIAALGVDFVKIGLRPEGDLAGTVAALGALARQGVGLIGVVFADLAPDCLSPAALAAAGFRGVMLDTAGKSGGVLTAHLGLPALGRFVAAARAAGLRAGLAGSLRAADIPALLALGPDYLGFRGALCAGGRAGGLEASACAAIRRAIPGDTRGLAAGEGLSIMAPG